MNLLGLEIRLPRIIPFERRKAERASIHEALYLDYQSELSNETGVAEGKDISTRGIRFACHSKFPKGTPLNLTLHFSENYEPAKVIQARGYVVRCYRKPLQKRYRVACAFESVNAESHEIITSFVRWLRGREEKYLFR